RMVVLVRLERFRYRGDGTVRSHPLLRADVGSHLARPLGAVHTVLPVAVCAESDGAARCESVDAPGNGTGHDRTVLPGPRIRLLRRPPGQLLLPDPDGGGKLRCAGDSGRIHVVPSDVIHSDGAHLPAADGGFIPQSY